MKKFIFLISVLFLFIGANQIGHTQQKNCNGPFQVDISSNSIHTFDEILSQLGIATLEQFNSQKPDFDMVIGGTLLLDKPNQAWSFYICAITADLPVTN